jgi:5-methyltetrahydrofolate--homocysteine methyltransferase
MPALQPAGMPALRTTLHTLRQQQKKMEGRTGEPYFALSDYIAPVDSNKRDYIGAFAVTAGHGLAELLAQFKSQGDDHSAILLEALADRLAEAFAEYLHKLARDDWGYGRAEKLSAEDLIAEKYRGIRPAPGYPACPDHTEKPLIFDLLQAEQNTEIKLTETYAMWPAAAVCGLYFSHAESDYFSVGRLGRDQVEDYAARKKMSVAEVERWLGPYLGYRPGS